MRRTLAIIKPDSVEKKVAGLIIDRIEKAGFRIVAMKMMQLSVKAAQGFYAVHTGKPFFDELVAFMTSGACIPMVLEKDDAVDSFRELIGATDPQKAEKGTIRADFATDIGKNAVHGSDSPANATIEINYFFSAEEISRGNIDN